MPAKKKKKVPSRPRLIKAGVPEPMFDFHSLGDERFEEICCHLLYYDMGVENPDLNDRPRRKQHGVDITADRIDGRGIDVASCKCYSSARKGQIEAWANEFLDHWESHWKNERVQRFILCVRYDLRSDERRRDIAAERQTASVKHGGERCKVGRRRSVAPATYRERANVHHGHATEILAYGRGSDATVHDGLESMSTIDGIRNYHRYLPIDARAAMRSVRFSLVRRVRFWHRKSN